MCDPCHNHWDAIVKMETFDRDASAILKVIYHTVNHHPQSSWSLFSISITVTIAVTITLTLTITSITRDTIHLANIASSRLPQGVRSNWSTWTTTATLQAATLTRNPLHKYLQIQVRRLSLASSRLIPETSSCVVTTRLYRGWKNCWPEKSEVNFT